MKDFLKKIYVLIRRLWLRSRRRSLVWEAWQRHQDRMAYAYLFDTNEDIDHIWKSSVELFDAEYKEIHEKLVPFNEKIERMTNEK